MSTHLPSDDTTERQNSTAWSSTADKSSATERTIDRIIGLIASGELAANQRLEPEAVLAERMEVSRSSLREAVRVLAYLGIVDVRVGDGTYVTDLDGERLLAAHDLVGQVANKRTVLEIFEIRTVLESAAASLAAVRATTDQLAELEATLDYLRAADTSEEFVKHDIRFHDLIAEATGNVSLQMLCRSFSAQTQRVRHVRGENVAGILQRSTAEHEDIYRYIADGEPTLASAAATSHVANVKSWLQQEIDRDSDEPVEPSL